MKQAQLSSRSTANKARARCSNALLDKYADAGIKKRRSRSKILKVDPLTAYRHRRLKLYQPLRRQGGLYLAAIHELEISSSTHSCQFFLLTHVQQSSPFHEYFQHHQIHPGHHAQGRRRRTATRSALEQLGLDASSSRFSTIARANELELVRKTNTNRRYPLKYCAGAIGQRTMKVMTGDKLLEQFRQQRHAPRPSTAGRH